MWCGSDAFVVLVWCGCGVGVVWCGSSGCGVWQAVVDVPPSLQRVVEFLLRVVDISQLYNVFYNAL